jgi:hypothetical protein
VKPEPADFFNVLTAEFEPMRTVTFGDARVDGRVLYESSDFSHLIIATRYPDGVRFRYGGTVDYEEAFYVAAGSGSRTFADGRRVSMEVGDLIFVHPGVEIDYFYGPGFADVAFFWSARRLPSDLVGGITTRHGGG